MLKYIYQYILVTKRLYFVEDLGCREQITFLFYGNIMHVALEINELVNNYSLFLNYTLLTKVITNLKYFLLCVILSYLKKFEIYMDVKFGINMKNLFKM